MFTIALLMNMLGIMIVVGGLIAVNVMSISSYSYSCDSYSYSYSLSKTTTTTTTNPNSCVTTFNYVQVGLAAVIFICCISFICAMQCVGGMRVRLGGGYGSRIGHHHHHGFGHFGGIGHHHHHGGFGHRGHRGHR
jgi:hypothetical protein